MDSMNAAVNAVNDVLWSYVLIVVLIACGLYFTFATRFVQVRMLPEMLRLLTEGIGKQTEGHAISSFQAFCVSTASRVGVGNIAGVAIAIVTGGPGAVFWMWLIAFIGCATGFVESTLAQIYKLPRGNGKFHGGPAYYIKNALHQPGVAKLFALLISVTFGLVYVSVQANTIALSAQTIGIDPAITAAFLCIFTALVICGGMHRIAKVTEFLVPIMAGLYLLVALVIILLHLSEVPAMFALIFHDAFSPQAAVGGGLGTAMITGIKRGLFSNEAGEGSVPNAAATAAVTHPVKQGLVQSFGVYVDTWIVCSATAFIILLTGQYTIGGECTGIALAQASLASVFGSLAPAAVSLMILLFAFSSIVGNYYYGEINIAFFDGNTRRYLAVFRVCVVLMVLFGSLATLQLVWNLADLFMGLLCLTNLYAITRLAPYARRALIDYQEKRAHGEDPSFTASDIDLTDGIYAWKK
ncbi:MAG: alanine/glycine:cation symporter family protein [Selenomonadaceae bacterium]|jgi:alanine or glycine:cation symporter, AGCS family|uniref:alanine/glycine:cation symporter family protein n=1 Tax=Selenomonas TaxID=970 RepID=UPI0004E177D1|nr:alanine/glycine:cation symporter family protein [Selenomonas bovis]MDY6273044.1 alanine/glycine:cation symporter family protein [Selenomonadaceae bacterium]MDY6299415.1 alanine/glycine:cation symporter family protein [Selenomonadaceae bacterium]